MFSPVPVRARELLIRYYKGIIIIKKRFGTCTRGETVLFF